MALPDDLSTRVAVITGASRGIGAGVARAFSARGLALGACARHRPTHLESGARPTAAGAPGTSADTDAAAKGPGLYTAQVDVRDGDAVDRFAREVEDRLGPIDLWINNAAVLDPVGPVRDLASGDVQAHLATNVLGVLHGTGTYARHLRRTRREGVLINISSGAAQRAIAGWGAYCASKAAVDMLTEVVALEEGPRLRAHSVAPGIVDTDMQASIRAQTPDRFPDVERFRALKLEGRFSSVEHVARHLLALAFDPEYPERGQVVLAFPPESRGP